MDTISQNRILLMEQTYTPIKLNQNRENLLNPKTINIEIYITWIIGLFYVAICCIISYLAVIDILGIQPKVWDAKVGMGLGHCVALLFYFFNSSRNGVILKHFLRIRDLTEKNVKTNNDVSKLNTAFIKLLKAKDIRYDLIISVVICFFSLFVSVYGIGDDNKVIPIWEYMKYILPFALWGLIFRQLYYLNEINKNIKNYEGLMK